MWQKGWRDKAWSQINKAWDLVVIGGGVTGAGIFREAALSGLTVLLLEAGDFASGTSSRSSKLVHGGLRYLHNGQIKTTFHSVRERQNLLSAGRGLVLPLEFLIIIYERDKIHLGFFRAGLSVYDILGMRWDHRQYKPADLLKLEPKIDSQGLVGGFRYMDAKVDDARLVLRIIQEGVRAGGLAVNYAKVEELLRRNDKSVSGVGFRDMAQDGDGRTCEAVANAVVNATGASADVLRRQVGGRPNLRILKGSHIVFSQRRLPLARAIGFAHPLDRRPVFAFPWEGVTVFGTTDLDYPAGDRGEPSLSPDEFEYLISAIGSVFPEEELKTEDVQAGFSGVRAVLDTGQKDPSKEPRDHAIWDEKGLVTVAGGKLTTFRIIARDVLRIVWKRFPGLYRKPDRCGLNQPEVIFLPPELPPRTRVRLIGRYGALNAKFITEAFQDELRPIDNGNLESPLWAELRWAARSEGIVHLDDLLLRRVRLGLILKDGAIRQMDRIRKIVQPELGWDNDRWDRELENYSRLWSSSYKLPTQRST